MPKPPKPEVKPFMTYVATRKPQWKQHKNIGQAKNAVIAKGTSGWYYNNKDTNDDPLEVWKLIESGEWELLWKIPRTTPPDELPWKS